MFWPLQWAIFRSQLVETWKLIRRTACAGVQFSGCSSTSNNPSEMGQMAVCCQNLPLGALIAAGRPLCWFASYLKSSAFFWTSGDSGNCDKRTGRHHRKCVPESISTMEEKLETLCRQWRGLLWRGQGLKRCKIKSSWKSSVFFWTHLVLLKFTYSYKNIFCQRRRRDFPQNFFFFNGATTRGEPWPPLQYASKPLDSLLCLSIRLIPSFSGPWTRHPAISFLAFLFVFLHTAFRQLSPSSSLAAA